ncbi:hypothetical protein EMCG_01251 [[Emmonsia] crescens]|uniref:Uncharacterized protein n=1 Tax=[Emmonsia] crescens TaxID=73230 RepID=A0A0G2J4A4_9EURO|nr:hypothetical protein EMCG_01251 [Emmonsia crescens UAMH 3008]
MNGYAPMTNGVSPTGPSSTLPKLAADLIRQFFREECYTYREIAPGGCQDMLIFWDQRRNRRLENNVAICPPSTILKNNSPAILIDYTKDHHADFVYMRDNWASPGGIFPVPFLALYNPSNSQLCIYDMQNRAAMSGPLDLSISGSNSLIAIMQVIKHSFDA